MDFRRLLKLGLAVFVTVGLAVAPLVGARGRRAAVHGPA